jgi:hypothetical protein
MLNGIILISIVTLVIYTAISASSNPWMYVALHFVLRTEEFLTVTTMLMLLSKKKPKVDISEDNSSQMIYVDE